MKKALVLFGISLQSIIALGMSHEYSEMYPSTVIVKGKNQ